jgi:C1A family cysteine protease
MFLYADKSLKKDIESLLERTRIIYSLISKLSFMDEANLYDEFQKDYKREVENLKTYKEQLLKKVKKLDKEITDKKQHTTEVLTLQIEINDEQFMSSIVKANIRIEECNQKTRDFSNAKFGLFFNLSITTFSTVLFKIFLESLIIPSNALVVVFSIGVSC